MSILSAYVMPHPPLIMPEVGRGEEKKIAATAAAMRRAAELIAAQKPETIVIVSPHADIYKDYFAIPHYQRAYGDMERFGAPQVSFDVYYDTQFTDWMENCAREEGFPAGRQAASSNLDHGTMVPLYFINERYRDYKLVRAGISGLSPIAHYRFGALITQAAEALSRRTVFIASGDLSHRLKEDGPYGLSPDGAIFDKRVSESLISGDFESFLSYSPDFCESAGECGLRSLQVLAGVIDETPVTTELLSYEGPFGVGYAVCSILPTT